MNNLNTSLPSTSKRSPISKSPSKGRNNIQEESHPRDEDEMSTSDDVELADLSEEDGLQDDEETGLTGKDKSKRKRRKRRNTLLDQRVAGDVKITAEEKKEADQNVFKKSLINGLLIGLWYLFSLSISIVYHPPNCWRETLTNHTVQQMDVRPQTSRFPLPIIHNLYAHARTVLPLVPRPLLPPTISTSIRFHIEPT